MNRLKELRQESNLSLHDLAKYVEIGESTLNLIENEKRAFKQNHIEKLASFFNVSIDYLLSKSERGIYIESNCDLVEITRNEFRSLRQRNKIHNRITIITDSYCVVRELISDYSSNSKNKEQELRKEFNKLSEKLDSEQLKKVIKFISEYIL